MAYEESKKPVREIAGDLKVDAVVEGAVMRFGDHIRIDAQSFQLQGQLNNTQPPSHVRDVEVDGFDRETLLVNWLNELLYLQEMNNETYANLEIQEISDTHLTARLHGQSGQPNRRLIKAVTFHGLKVEQSEGAWRATVIVDV